MNEETHTASGLFQWIVFDSAGQARVSHGDTIQKAVSNWKKAREGKAEAIGVIRCGFSDSLPTAIRGTDVFGVICCVHKSKGAKP